MRKCILYICICSVSVLCVSCFSLMKADHMVYAGSLGKKVDAALIDSIQKIEINSEK